MTKHDLFDKPNQIFNADETGFSNYTKGSASKFAQISNYCCRLSGKWVIVNSSCRHVFEANGGNGKEYRTALICISANGKVLPPFILYAGKNIMNTWCKGGLVGSQYGVTKKVS